jgi:hypothetical protein
VLGSAKTIGMFVTLLVVVVGISVVVVVKVEKAVVENSSVVVVSHAISVDSVVTALKGCVV